MKRIEAIIRPSKLEAVHEALRARGIDRFAVSIAEGTGAEPPPTQVSPAAGRTVPFGPKIKLDVLVTDELATPIVHDIVEAARTGRVGDGRIFVMAVEDVVVIRTGKHVSELSSG